MRSAVLVIAVRGLPEEAIDVADADGRSVCDMFGDLAPGTGDEPNCIVLRSDPLFCFRTIFRGVSFRISPATDLVLDKRAVPPSAARGSSSFDRLINSSSDVIKCESSIM